jgi:hypothetical protein
LGFQARASAYGNGPFEKNLLAAGKIIFKRLSAAIISSFKKHIAFLLHIRVLNNRFPL